MNTPLMLSSEVLRCPSTGCESLVVPTPSWSFSVEALTFLR